MADLNDFLDAPPQYSLDTFGLDNQQPPSYINEATAKNAAAHAVALGGPTNSTLNTYDTVNGELTVGNTSALYEQIKQDVATGDRQRAQQVLPGIVEDPTVPDDVKKTAVTDSLDPNSDAYNASNLLSRRALQTPSTDPTPEQDNSNLLAASAMRTVNAVKAQRQAMYNAFVAKNDPNVASKIGSVLGGLIPLTSEARSSALVGQVIPDSSWWDKVHAFFLPGSGKQQVADYLNQLPLNEQVEATGNVLAAIKDTSGILSDSSNNANAVTTAAQIVQGDYTGADKVSDNAAFLLDAMFFGGAALRATKAAGAARTAAEGDRIAGLYGDIGKPPPAPPGASGAASGAKATTPTGTSLTTADWAARENAIRDFMHSSVQPASVAGNLKDTNPQMARLTHNIVANDTTDEAAQALYGTTRNEAIASDHAPEVAHTDSSVNNKVSEPNFSPENTLDPDIADFVNNDGFTALEQSEKARARALVVNNFADALTANPRTEMWQLGGITPEEYPEGVRISAVYGPSGHGYADPYEARELFKWAHRDWGLTDDNITILERNGSSYQVYQPEDAVKNNGSSPGAEGAGSQEAISRTSGQKAKGQLMFRINRNDTIEPMNTVDNADIHAGPGEMIVQRGIGKDEWTTLSSGNDLSKDVQIGKLNRNLSKLNSAVKEHLASTPGTKSPGEYLVQVTYDYRFKPGDIEDWYNTTVKRNFFDSASPFNSEATHGSLTQHVFPSTSTLDPVMALSALTTSDKAAGLEKGLLHSLDLFSKTTKKLSADRYGKVLSKIQDANLRGYTPTTTNLIAEGFTNDEIHALKTWRKFWDNIWWLHNLDHNRNARALGHKMYVDNTNDTYLEVKPVKQRGSITSSVDIADPRTGSLKTLTPEDIDFIYERGGLLAELETPVKIGDDFATHVVSMETPDNYLRAINDGDISLHYRQGYYHVAYKGPYFIDRVWSNPDGSVKNKTTIYSSDNRKDADMVAARLDKSVDDDSTHVVRTDTKLGNRKKNAWDLMKASGMSAQRFRGQRLMDATSTMQGPGQGHILSPIEAAVSSVRSISKRATAREWLDTTKARYIATRGDYLSRNEFQQPVFPANRSQIAIQPGKKGTRKGLADARTEFDYIRSMENGYVNSIDDVWKAGLNTIADILGEKHITLAEKAARGMAKTSLTGQAKKLSFGLFLALNPVRQLLIQAHQGVMLAAINPGWLTTRAAPQLMYIVARQVGMPADTMPNAFFKALGMTKKQAEQMFDALERSGLSAGVDKHSIVRGSLNDMADMMVKGSGRSIINKAVRPVRTIGHYSRLLGFDAGEWFNIVSAWAAHYDMARKAGLDLSKSDVQASIAARARNFTGSMNAAGDMPYNANELNVLLQFQQQSHKMFSLMTTNRVLSRVDRLKLLAFTAVMFGIPTTLGALLWAGMSNDKDTDKQAAEKAHAIELLQRGAESAILNRTASALSGDKVDIDFSSLNPLNMYGTTQLVHSLFTTSAGDILANTPSGSLLFGGNPRLTRFVKTTAQYFHLMDDNGVPVTFAQESKAFANLSSGLSNAFRAAYSLKYGQALSSYSGNVTDPNVTAPEAMAKFFGFSTWTAAQKAAESQEFYMASQDLETDVNKWYAQFRSDMARDDLTPDEMQFIVRAHNKAFQIWGSNDRVNRIIEHNLMRDAAKGDLTFYKRATQSLGIMSYQDWRLLVLNTPQVSDDMKQQILQIGEVFHNAPDSKEGKY